MGSKEKDTLPAMGSVWFGMMGYDMVVVFVGGGGGECGECGYRPLSNWKILGDWEI